MASASERHMRPEHIGFYRVVWAQSNLTKEVSYRVYYLQDLDPISEHPTRTLARAAVKRYQEADKRRQRQADHERSQRILDRLTPHLKDLGVI